jgi:DNA-binding transcriptional LysR family regulator
MELEHLRSFLALAGQLHFGRTARLLNVSQPALTKRIRQLESEIGGQLFRRGRSGTYLTDVGRLLFDEAGELVRFADQLLNDMRRAARGEIGRLGIGFGFHTFELVPRVVAQFRRRAPDVQVKLRDMSTREQLAALSSGTIDIGFVRLPVTGDLEQLPVIQDSLAIVRSLESKGNRHLRLADCREEAFIMLSSERSPAFRQHALRLCAKYGFSPRIVQEAHELPTLFALASAGVGIAVVPISACRAGIRGVQVHPISDKEARWTVGAAWRKGEKSVLVTGFLELLKKELTRENLTNQSAREIFAL